MSKIIGGFVLGVLFMLFIYLYLNPPYKMFKCEYYGKGWDFEVTKRGIDIVCLQ